MRKDNELLREAMWLEVKPVDWLYILGVSATIVMTIITAAGFLMRWHGL